MSCDLDGNRQRNILKSDEHKEKRRIAITLDKVVPPDSQTIPNKTTRKRITSGEMPSNLIQCNTQIERAGSRSDLPGSILRTGIPYNKIVTPNLPGTKTSGMRIPVTSPLYTKFHQQVNQSKSDLINDKWEKETTHQKVSKSAMPALTVPQTQQQVKHLKSNLLQSVGTHRQPLSANSSTSCWSRSPGVMTKNITIPYGNIPQQVNWSKSDFLKGKWEDGSLGHQVSKPATPGSSNSKGLNVGTTIPRVRQQEENLRFDLPRSNGTVNDKIVKMMTLSPRRIEVVAPGESFRKMTPPNAVQQVRNSKIGMPRKTENLYREFLKRASQSPKMFDVVVPRKKLTQVAESNIRQQVKNSIFDTLQSTGTPHYGFVKWPNLSPTKMEISEVKSRQLPVPKTPQQVRNCSKLGQLCRTRTPHYEIVHQEILSPTRIEDAMSSKLTTPNTRQQVKNLRSDTMQNTETPYDILNRVLLSPRRTGNAVPGEIASKSPASTDSTRQQVNYQNSGLFKEIRKNKTSHQRISKSATTSFVPTLRSTTSKLAALRAQKQLVSSNSEKHLPSRSSTGMYIDSKLEAIPNIKLENVAELEETNYKYDAPLNKNFENSKSNKCKANAAGTNEKTITSNNNTTTPNASEKITPNIKLVDMEKLEEFLNKFGIPVDNILRQIQA